MRVPPNASSDQRSKTVLFSNLLARNAVLSNVKFTYIQMTIAIKLRVLKHRTLDLQITKLNAKHFNSLLLVLT